MIRNFLSSFPIFILRTVLVTNPLTHGILFPNSPIFVLKSLLVTNPLTSFFFSTSPSFLLEVVLVTKSIVSGIQVFFYQHLLLFI